MFARSPLRGSLHQTRPRHQDRNESRPSVRSAHGCAPASPLRGSTRTAAPRRPRQSQTNLPIECRIGRRCAARCRRESSCPGRDPHAPASASQLVLLSRRISGGRFESSSSVALCCTTVTASKRQSLWHSRRPRDGVSERRGAVYTAEERKRTTGAQRRLTRDRVEKGDDWTGGQRTRRHGYGVKGPREPHTFHLVQGERERCSRESRSDVTTENTHTKKTTTSRSTTRRRHSECPTRETEERV